MLDLNVRKLLMLPFINFVAGCDNLTVGIIITTKENESIGQTGLDFRSTGGVCSELPGMTFNKMKINKTLKKSTKSKLIIALLQQLYSFVYVKS